LHDCFAVILIEIPLIIEKDIVMKLMTPAVLLSAALLSTAAFAQSYVGVSVGQGQLKDASLDISGYGNTVTNDLDFDKKRVAGSIYAGYQFNPYFAVEVTAGGIDAINGDTVTVGSMMYFAAAPKVSYPLTNNFSVFGKWGLAHFSAETTLNTGIAGSYTTEDSYTSGIMSVGAEFALNDFVSLRASWDYLRPELEIGSVNGVSATVETDIHIYSVGLNYKF